MAVIWKKLMVNRRYVDLVILTENDISRDMSDYESFAEQHSHLLSIGPWSIMGNINQYCAHCVTITSESKSGFIAMDFRHAGANMRSHYWMSGADKKRFLKLTLIEVPDAVNWLKEGF